MHRVITVTTGASIREELAFNVTAVFYQDGSSMSLERLYLGGVLVDPAALHTSGELELTAMAWDVYRQQEWDRT